MDFPKNKFEIKTVVTKDFLKKCQKSSLWLPCNTPFSRNRGNKRQRT